MKLLKILLPIFHVYQICGFAPFSMQFDAKTKHRMVFIYTGFLIKCLAIFVAYNIFVYKTFFEEENSQMLSYLTFLILISVRIVGVVITIESLVNRREHLDWLIKLNQIDQMFAEQLKIGLNHKQIRRNGYIWLVVWLIQISICFLMVLVDILQDNSSVWLKIVWIICIIPLFLPTFRYFQIIHYIQLLEFVLATINKQLKAFYTRSNRLDVSKRSKNPNFVSNEDEIYDRIVLLRKIYHMLWESTVKLNKIFQFSLLLLIGSSFLNILVNYYRTLYWLLSTTAPESTQLVIAYFYWSIGHTFYFIILSNTCYNISQQVF